MLGRLNGKSKILSSLLQTVVRKAAGNIPNEIWAEITSQIEIPQQSHIVIDKIYRDILYLRLIIDELHGIGSQLVEHADLGRVWIRRVDQTNPATASPNQRAIEVYNCLRLFYAYLIAAIVVAIINKVDSPKYLELVLQVKLLISEAFHQLMQESDKDCFALLAESKAYLIELMGLHGIGSSNEEVNLWLDQAKDWVALESSAIPIITFLTANEAQKKQFIIYDDAVCELTDEQRSLLRDLPAQCWYQELTQFEQSLVQYYQTAILIGTRIIPSQLRAILPFCKNAYLQSLWVVEDNQMVTLLNSYFHAGTVAYVSHKKKEEALRITRANFAQQKQVTGSQYVLNVCLNSSMADRFVGTYEWLMRRPYVADDSEIIALTYQVASQAEGDGYYYAKLCVNQMRYLEYNDYSGINKIINIIKKNLSMIAKSEQAASELVKELERVIALEWQFSFFDLDVKGLDIIHRLTKVVTLNNQLQAAYPQLALTSVSIWFGCASGENRTGITYFHVIASTLLDYLTRNVPAGDVAKIKETIISLIAVSQHVLVITGHQGSTFGTEGIRGKSIGTFKAWHPKNQLLTKTSELKKVPPDAVYLNGLLTKIADLLVTKNNSSESKVVLDVIRQTLQLVKNAGVSLFMMNRQERDLITTVLHLFVKRLTLNIEDIKPVEFINAAEAIKLQQSQDNVKPSSLFSTFATLYLANIEHFIPVANIAEQQHHAKLISQ